MNSTMNGYGSETCSHTMQALAHLEQLGLEYEFIDIDEDPDAERRVIAWNDGKRKMPTIEILSHGESRMLGNPGIERLDQALAESHVDEEGDHRLRRAE
jgi:glutaredoxin